MSSQSYFAFSNAFKTALFEAYENSTFDFSKHPFFSFYEVVGITSLYLILLGIISILMKKSKPFKLTLITIIHNLLLSLGSLVLLVLILTEILPFYWENGLFESICSIRVFNPRLELLYYLNYLFKVLELFDTVFLALKKKPLTFLHVYHHFMTFALCWSQLVGKTSVQWVPIVINLLVHVIMYYYYFIVSLKKTVWWKKHLTTMQIIQFLIDLVFCYYASIVRVLHNMNRINYDCQGNLGSAIFGCILLSSYLVLFIQFFMNTYTAKNK